MQLDINQLKDRASKLGEDELIKIALANSHEYHPDAVDVARAELRRRGYTVEIVVTKPTGGGAAMPPLPPLPPLPKPPPVIRETEAEAIQEKEADQKMKGAESESEDKRSRRNILSLLGTVITLMGVVIAGVVGKGCSQMLFQLFTQEKAYTNSDASWARRKIPDIGISVDLPGDPTQQEITLPPQAKGMIRSHKSYGYNEGGLSVGVSHVVYADHITANPEGAARGAIENL
ncbi:MAG: hypothetical protein L0220_21645, partial [Acidobacteria bacterium]|nr:hypothetical protein [Acidobacteriota bacterium]